MLPTKNALVCVCKRNVRPAHWDEMKDPRGGSASTHLDNVIVGKLVPSLLERLGRRRRELPKWARTEDPDGAPRVEGSLELGLRAALGLLVRPSFVLEQQLPLGPPFRLGDGSSFPFARFRVRSFVLFSVLVFVFLFVFFLFRSRLCFFWVTLLSVVLSIGATYSRKYKWEGKRGAGRILLT